MNGTSQAEDEVGATLSDADRLASARAAYLRDHGPIARSLLGAERWMIARAVKEEPFLLRGGHDGLERFRAKTSVLSDGRLLVAIWGRPG